MGEYLADLLEWLAVCAVATTVFSLAGLGAWALVDSFVL
jgi:hypothetical protein